MDTPGSSADSLICISSTLAVLRWDIRAPRRSQKTPLLGITGVHSFALLLAYTLSILVLLCGEYIGHVGDCGRKSCGGPTCKQFTPEYNRTSDFTAVTAVVRTSYR